MKSAPRSDCARRPRRSSTFQSRLVVCIFWVLFFSSLSAGMMGAAFWRLGLLGSLRLSPLTLPILCLVLSTLLGMLLSGPLARYYLAPLSQLINATREVKAGHFDVRVQNPDASGEVAELTESFNEMTRELGAIELFRNDFVNSFSHEFKTPIVSIRGFARQLEREDLTPEQRREYLSIIITESERLSNMATNVLLLTKLESQQIVSDRKPYRLDEQLRSAILLLERQWSEKNLELNLELSELTYTGNEEMVAHVWINLISNAIKFSYPNGVLDVSLSLDVDAALVRIADHGEGMDEVTRAHMFEKFYQGDTSHATQGNGLGLSLVRRIIELCRGTLDVQSAPGQGSAFTVRLPLGDAPAQEPH